MRQVLMGAIRRLAADAARHDARAGEMSYCATASRIAAFRTRDISSSAVGHAPLRPRDIIYFRKERAFSLPRLSGRGAFRQK